MRVTEEEAEGRKRGKVDNFGLLYSKRIFRRFSYHQEGTYSGKRKHSHKRRKSEPHVEKEPLELETITTIGMDLSNDIIINYQFSFTDSRYGILN